MNERSRTSDRARPARDRRCAAARAELKLSVADVSQQIKYGVKQIAAIESDDYAKLPGTTFVRGMIRSYAKLVQIDPEPLLADLVRRDIPAAVTVDLRTSGQEPFIESGGKSNRIYVSLSVAALVAVAVVAYEWQVNPVDTGEVVTIKTKAAQGEASPAAAQAAAPLVPAPQAQMPPAPLPVDPAPPVPASVSVPEPAATGDARAAEPRARTALCLSGPRAASADRSASTSSSTNCPGSKSNRPMARCCCRSSTSPAPTG